MEFVAARLRGIALSADKMSATIAFEGEGGATAEITIPSDQLHPLLMLAASAGGHAEPVLGLETIVPVRQVGVGALSNETCVVAMVLPDGMPLRFALPWEAALLAATTIQEEHQALPPVVRN